MSSSKVVALGYPGKSMGCERRFQSCAARYFEVVGWSESENVSLRELTTAAGVNLAAVNSHFGPEEAL